MATYVALIFHKGGLIDDKSGLLEPGPKGKAYAKFHSMEEVNNHKANLQKVGSRLDNLMDE